MNDEIYELFDETMEINHQITSYIIKIAEADFNGVKINGSRDIGIKEIEENALIKTLFERLQSKYRELAETINNYEEKAEEEYVILSDYMQGDYDKNELYIEELKDYLSRVYANLRYLPLLNEEGEIIQKSIYAGSDFETLHYTDFSAQIENLNNMFVRLNFNLDNEKVNFEEKIYVIEDLSKKIFLKELAIDEINNYIEVLETNRDELIPELYDEILHNFYEQKYAIIFDYLENKYNGVIQENDIDKYGIIKKFIDEENETIILNMEQSEINSIIRLKIEEYQDSLKNLINNFFEIQQEKASKLDVSFKDNKLNKTSDEEKSSKDNSKTVEKNKTKDSKTIKLNSSKSDNEKNSKKSGEER